MVAFYVDRIAKGFMELEQFPTLWKEKVKEELGK